MLTAERASMTETGLLKTVSELVAPGQGILAVDESVATISKRFAALGIDSTPESRRAYRETLLMCPGIGEFISGAILYDETLRQTTSDGVPFPTAMRDAGIICGIKVDTGAKQLAGCPSETVTDGLDGLRERIAEYVELGARFAKWRAVIQVDARLPSRPPRPCDSCSTNLSSKASHWKELSSSPTWSSLGNGAVGSRASTRSRSRRCAVCGAACPLPWPASPSSAAARARR
jgi:fructose-bisphosphate aldolase class 1